MAEKTLLSYGVENACYLCDDYIDFTITLYGITYPSVRHAVLSLKTNDQKLKLEISKTLLPFDLKDLEKRITRSECWTKEFAQEAREELTFVKFESRPDFVTLLCATRNIVLTYTPFDGEGVTQIEELITEDYGLTLMRVRDYWQKKKAP